MISVYFVRGYVIVTSFLLCMFGLSAIFSNTYISSSNPNESYVYINDAEKIHKIALDLGITLGSLVMISGIIGLIGVFARK